MSVVTISCHLEDILFDLKGEDEKKMIVQSLSQRHLIFQSILRQQILVEEGSLDLNNQELVLSDPFVIM